jgi:ABC-type xylose transport system permease subunit
VAYVKIPTFIVTRAGMEYGVITMVASPMVITPSIAHRFAPLK